MRWRGVLRGWVAFQDACVGSGVESVGDFWVGVRRCVLRVMSLLFEGVPAVDGGRLSGLGYPEGRPSWQLVLGRLAWD